MKATEFFQEGPEIKNTFTSHRWLKAYLKNRIPPEYWPEIEADLTRLGENCAGMYLTLARQAEREKPVHVPYDPWGKRIDEIRVSSAWVELQNISAREGMIHIGYKRAQKEFSRLYQFAKLYLFHPSSAFFTCPLAMADGAARVLELNGGSDATLKEAFQHLTTNEPENFWTSGQWMTERSGGSDVSGTETVARVENGQIRLYGTKWFTSATTSQMALALARYEDSPPGSRGLSLFYVPTYLSGKFNNIQILRLKDKLGTWALPTAELQLQGSLAYPVGERDQGVKTVATMLNITRLYNSVCSVGQMARALDQLRDYSEKRKVFSRPLVDQVLHHLTFGREDMKSLAGFLLTMELVYLLGREECGVATAEEQDLLRLMTPICKLFTARVSLQTASEVVEGFGGAGYIEDTGVPVHLRDSQVFSIWEGATNVLSLDLIRVVQKTPALSSLKNNVRERIKNVKSRELQDTLKKVSARWNELERYLGQWAESAPEMQAANSRDVAFHLAWNYSVALLLSWADRETGANQKTLNLWLAEMESGIEVPRMRTPEECQNSRQAFTARLNI